MGLGMGFYAYRTTGGLSASRFFFKEITVTEKKKETRLDAALPRFLQSQERTTRHSRRKSYKLSRNIFTFTTQIKRPGAQLFMRIYIMVDAQQLVYCTCMLNQQGAADKKSYDGITSVIMATFKPFFYLNLFTLSFSPPPTQPEAIKDRSRQNAKKAKRFRETIDTKEKKKSKRQSQTTNNKKMQKMLVLKKKKKDVVWGKRQNANQCKGANGRWVTWFKPASQHEPWQQRPSC